MVEPVTQSSEGCNGELDGVGVMAGWIPDEGVIAMDGRRSSVWRVMGCVLGCLACLGCANPLPTFPAEAESSGAGLTTTEVETQVDATTKSGATTEMLETSTVGALAGCDNGEVEDGEECDGMDSDGATCQSLGFSETGLMCVGCQLDASRCGPPPGMVEVPGGSFEMGSTATSFFRAASRSRYYDPSDG